jgi:hypothetical protein
MTTTTDRSAAMARRLAQLRAELGTEPLVSHVDDPEPIRVGSVLSQRVDPLAAHQPVTGRVVERWHNADGEPGLVLVSFSRSKALTHRLLVDHVVTEAVTPPDPYGCTGAVRSLWSVLGAGRGTLDDHERRLLAWCQALLVAGGQVAALDPYPA